MLTAVFTETAMPSPSAFPKINQKLNDLRAALEKATEKLDALSDAVDQIPDPPLLTEDQIAELQATAEDDLPVLLTQEQIDALDCIRLDDEIPGMLLSEMSDEERADFFSIVDYNHLTHSPE